MITAKNLRHPNLKLTPLVFTPKHPNTFVNDQIVPRIYNILL